uniref:Alpha-centractin (Trinotate prediction) n=1 Tax=Myxobolus squamalis TaxID=59785 RepID=A0A6B2FY17_MYXSQ
MSFNGSLGKALVVDFGSDTVKVGYAGDPTPKFIIPNVYGLPKYPRILLSSGDNVTYVGSQVNEMKGLLNIFPTLEHGSVVDVDNMGRIWSYIYGPSVLNIDPRDHPVLVTEPVLSSYKTKESIFEYLFESLSVPAVCFACAPVLSLYGNGFHTGCVLDSGAGVTSAVAICNGYSLTHSAKRTNIAGMFSFLSL